MLQQVYKQTVQHIGVIYLNYLQHISRPADSNLKYDCYWCLLNLRNPLVDHRVNCIFVQHHHYVYGKTDKCRDYNEVNQLQQKRNLFDIDDQLVFLDYIFEVHFDEKWNCDAAN
jgi:hypothetical protein